MKTREEVDALKANWCSDPCWDIEDTEGFEEYHDELTEYRIRYKGKIAQERLEYETGVAKELNTSIEMARKIIGLEIKIEYLLELSRRGR